MKNCVVLIGAPCSGKSTIGRGLARLAGYKYISSGDIARNIANSREEIDNLNAGCMANEDSMRRAVLQLFDSGDDIVLDGFPRFVDQLNWFMDNIVCALNYNVLFIEITASAIDIASRASKRGRSDDASIERRIRWYDENTVPMIRYIKDLYHMNILVINNEYRSDYDESSRI